jgi:hypothetical protein
MTAIEAIAKRFLTETGNGARSDCARALAMCCWRELQPSTRVRGAVARGDILLYEARLSAPKQDRAIAQEIARYVLRREGRPITRVGTADLSRLLVRLA